MLVPLEGTLPGWPVANEPSALEVLGLLIGIPGLVFVLIAVLGKGSQLIRAGRGESAVAVDEPLWLGAAPADRSALTSDGTASVPGEGRRALTTAEGSEQGSEQLGGASARW
jgi:hypothetical protein